MAALCLPAPRTAPSWDPVLRLLAAFGARRDDPSPAQGGASRAEVFALRSREPEAWRELFEREHPAIYRYVASRLGQGPEAEDLTSQVFAHAWESAHLFEDRGLPVRAWLFGIARNVVNGHRRSWFRRVPQIAIESVDAGSHDPGLDEERLDLARAVARLDPAWAEVVTLRFIHGLSLQETADVLGATVDSVKGKQARALAELRRLLERS